MPTVAAFRAPTTFVPLVDLFDELASWRQRETYPSHSYEKIGQDRYRLTLAVPGFGEDDLSIEANSEKLTVRGRKQGSASRFTAHAFEFRAPLGEHMRVTGAHLAHGLLTIDLARELPEALRPRVIPIRGETKLPLLPRRNSTSADNDSMIAKLRRVLTGRKAA